MKQPQRTPEQLAKLVIAAGETDLPTEQALKELDPLKHDVFDEAIRKRKDVAKPNGIIGEDGKEGKTIVKEEVNRIAIPFQQLIVKRRVAFMNVGELELRARPETNEGSDQWTDEEKLFEIVKKIREDNKMQYRETEVAKRMLTELQVAKLWYTDDVDAGYWGDLALLSKKSVRCKVLSPALGDKLYPVFDGYGKMVYFARSFKSKPNALEVEPGSDTDAEEKEVLEVYSKDTIWTFVNGDDGWIPVSMEPHTFGKIPVIYYQKDSTPWANVQPIINRIETVLSNFADTTDYNGAPILVGTGEITSMSERGDRGKTFMMDEGASLEYVTWESAPEAIKLELETLINLVYTCTQTPDISTKGMAELAIESGVAFDRVFIDAHLAAKDEIAGGYGECTQREINLLKAITVNVINTGLKKAEGLEITFDIPLFRINDSRETVDTVSVAYQGGLISQETAVGLSGLTDDPGEEILRIRKENDTLGQEMEEE